MQIQSITNINPVYIYKKVSNNINKITNKETAPCHNPAEKHSTSKTVSFKGGLKTPLSDEDYKRAKNYSDKNLADIKEPMLLKDCDLEQLEGIQKGIKVFEGLSIKDIEQILSGRLLLNRGCNNQCLHCGFSAAPFSNETQDRISYEDLISLLEGIKELQKRTHNNVIVERGICSSPFLDSDCIDVELYDKEGNVYDYVDCIKTINNYTRARVLFDTSGWNPNSEKHQKRAEKLVDYLFSDENKIKTVYVSINPYHPLYAKSKDNTNPFKMRQSKEMQKMYYKRIANAMYTFTPFITSKEGNFDYGLLVRGIDKKKAKTKLDENCLNEIKHGILKELKTMYENDLQGEQKYIKSNEDIKKVIAKYSNMLGGADEIGNSIEPIGRGEALFKKPESTMAQRQEELIKYLKENQRPVYKINPNGSVFVMLSDASIKTDLSLNFENKSKKSKPFGHEIQGLTYIINGGEQKFI